VLYGVMLPSLFGVVRRVSEVPVRDVRMVPGLYVVAGFVMLRGFAVVPGCMLMVIGRLMMVRSACVICHCLWFSLVNRIGPGSRPRLIIHQTHRIIK
jgi:hypothetical protein